MMRMREHIYRLYGHYFIFSIKQLKITCLSSRITTYIYNTLRLGKQNYIYHIVMHTRTRRVGNNYIRTTMFIDKILRQDIFHITGIEQRILNTVYLRVDFCILNSFGNIFYTNNLPCLAGNKVCNRTRTGIKVVHQFVASQPCEVASYLIKIICLF